MAAAKGAVKATLAEFYQDEYMQAIRKPASRGRQANVLQHMAGYFKRPCSTPATAAGR